ncbi:hypothetical protein FSP39_017030 [Pinctada imbricata]|uniref:Uncharacterized protein n=1 Tax=Pinctada imbricata TaxID=66713 RepID=A0AA88YK20_PINIB|nr:hypothetical protein FSP39_017030 [Pinctada imbricata]
MVKACGREERKMDDSLILPQECRQTITMGKPTFPMSLMDNKHYIDMGNNFRTNWPDADTKQTNGTDFVYGMNSPEDLKMMEPYKTPADDEVIPKQNTNGDFGMDQDNPFGVQGQNQDLLSDTKDQQVPQNLDTFDTLPADIGTSVDESSHNTTGADGVLIDFEGKESPKPNTVPGMQRLNPFVQSNDTETNSSNPFLSDYSEPPDQGGLSESMECHEDQDISPSDESSLTSSSLSQRQDMPVGGEQQFQSDIAPVDATEMEFESSPSNFDQSLSSAVGGPMPETYKTDEFQTEEVQSGDSAIELGDQAQDVIQDDVAQSAEDVPVAPAEMEEVPSQYERKISHDEQIVPGVCSCIEPEPESSGSENNDNEQMEGVQKVEERPTPEIRLQREDNDYVDSGEIDGENEGDVNEFYDDQSDEDELTPSENLTRSGEGELVVMSDPGVVRRGDDEEYSDEGEGVEIYTDDESYSDEEYVEGEGRVGDRASEDREFSF